ncbi:helix-turn-helix domain-containing protein [Pedobacter caeni]|uniref:helix-turn-helix domain-containing protein n=1 Tax=Pedobacter caeni TaxID=288992 RepID=UPI00093324D9|nr:helix-turn-helix domain-containing protein [Pedobacter caeni]
MFVNRLWHPGLLLLGPLVFLSSQLILRSVSSLQRKDLIHFIPFLIVGFLYSFLISREDWNEPVMKLAFLRYQDAYFLIIFSLLFYSLFTLVNMWNPKNESDTPMVTESELLVIITSAVYILISLMMVILYGSVVIFRIHTGIDFRLFSYGLLTVIAITIVRYLFVTRNAISGMNIEARSMNLEPGGYDKSLLSTEYIQQHSTEILQYFKNNMTYLDPDFSLSRLSEELGISEHKLSQLFNRYFQKKFYTFLAEYRIEHAIELMKNNKHKLKIETLSYSCGFNSKASFYHYFKVKMGCSPYEYQKKLDLN